MRRAVLLLFLWLTACNGAVVEETTMPVPDTLTRASLTLADGTLIEYDLYLPPDFDPAATYPVLLAFPPGDQTLDLVRWGMESYWAPGARAHGWLVVSPAAPAGQLFFRGSEAYIPEFLGQIAAVYPPAGDKFYLGGVSNGGRSAFRVATERPDLFQAMAVLPGFPPSADDFAHIDHLAAIPVAMWVGERDTYWVEQMTAAAAALEAAGGQVTLTVLPGEDHVIQGLVGGAEIFDFLTAP